MVTSVVLYEGRDRHTLRPILATMDRAIVATVRRLLRDRIDPPETTRPRRESRKSLRDRNSR